MESKKTALYSNSLLIFSISLEVSRSILLAFAPNRQVWRYRKIQETTLSFSPHPPDRHPAPSGLALAFNIGVAIYEIYTIRKYKKNLFKEELYMHLKCYQEVAES